MPTFQSPLQINSEHPRCAKSPDSAADQRAIKNGYKF